MSTPQQPYSSEAKWGSVAQSYGSNVHKTSSSSASQLVSFASKLAPIGASSKILDVGSGTGAVTVQVLTTTEAHVTASDIHQSMLDSIVAPAASKLVRQTADARSLSKTFKQEYSHVFCTFMLQTIANPLDALRQMHHVLLPSVGVVGIACWGERIGPYEIWIKACQSIDPSYQMPPPFDDPQAWRSEEEVAAGLRQAGFEDVQTKVYRSPFPFENTKAFQDFWFRGKNPGAEKVINSWHGSAEEVEEAFAKVCREQYDDGRAVFTTAVLGIGRVGPTAPAI